MQPAPIPPLRILFVATEWASSKGGVSTFNRELAIAVAQLSGTEVWCVVPEHPSQDDIKGATAAGVGLLMPGLCPGIPRTNSLARLLAHIRHAYPPDGPPVDSDDDQIASTDFAAIVGHGRWTGPAALQLARRHNIPVTVQFVHVDPAIEFDKDRSAPAGHRYDENNSVDLALCEAAAVRFGVGPRLAAVFRHRIDVEEMLPGFRVGNEPRTGKPRHALLVGRMEDAGLKGLHYALYAMQILATPGSLETVLELRGADDEAKTNAEVNRLLSRIRQQQQFLDHNRLVPRVTPFTTDAEHIDASYQRASVVLMPSTQEGFGLVALEALERGRPVVASNKSGFAMLVRRCAPELADKFIYESERIIPEDISRVGRVADRISERVGAFFDDPGGTAEAVAALQDKLTDACSWERSATQLVHAIQAEQASGPNGSDASGPPDATTPPAPVRVDPLEAASSGLRSWPRQIRKTWLPRQEQAALLAAVEDRDGSDLVLLMGGPGSGKSALLGWLDEQLRPAGWSVLSIKADQLPADQIRTVVDLSRWLGFAGADLLTLLEDRSRAGNVALIVDQLDALAALTDLKSSRLNVLLTLIYQSVELSGVKVIASMREMEARYDPRLRRLSSGRRVRRPAPFEVRLGPLNSEAVSALWAESTGEALSEVPTHLLEPRTLKLAVRLGKTLSNTREVMTEFWRCAVDPSKEEYRKSLFDFADALEAGESFWAEMPETDAAQYWVEQGLLESRVGRDGSVLYGFSHQTLQETARARGWLARETQGSDPAESLARWTEARLDLLNIRPRIVSVLDVLRGEAPASYIKAIGLLLRLARRRLHLRELIAVQIGRSEGPSDREVAWMRELMEDPEPGVRFASIAAASGSRTWFDALSPWVESQLDTPDGLRFQHFLAAAWPFARSTIEDWLRRYWSVGAEQTRAALWVMSQRHAWPDDAAEFALAFAHPDVDDVMLGALTTTLSRQNLNLAVKVRARYVARCWERTASSRPNDTGDGYRVPIEYGWRKAAAQAPEVFVAELLPAFLGLSETLAGPAGRSGYRTSVDSILYDARWGRPAAEDTPLVAFGAALEALAAQRIESFKSARGRLANSETELAQLVALRAHSGCAATHPGEVAEFLLADPRRLRLNPPVARLLTKLAPHLSDEHRDALVTTVNELQRVVPTELSLNPEHLAAVEETNAEYREGLVALLMGTPDEQPAQRVLVERSMKSGTVVSPCSADEITALTDTERVGLARSYPDGEGDNDLHEWRAGAFVGGNQQLASEIGRWAETEPQKAVALLTTLRSEEDPASPQHLNITSNLLCGLATSDAVPPHAWLELFAATVADRYGLEPLGRRSSSFRHLLALALGKVLERGGNASASELLDIIEEWIEAEAVSPDDDEPGEELGDEELLFPHGPGAIFSSELFQHVDALTLALLSPESRDWARLLKYFGRLLDAVPGKTWCHLLLLRRLRAPIEFRPAWQDWLDALMASRPEALARKTGMSVLWRNFWDAAPERVMSWLELITQSQWRSAARAVAELTTMLSVVEPHASWARLRLERTLTSLSEDSVGIGVAHGLAFLWSESAVRHYADPYVQEFVRTAPQKLVHAFLTGLRREAFRPNRPFLNMATSLMKRDLDWPPRQGGNLADALLEAVEYDPEAVAPLALGFANGVQQRRLGFASEPLLSLAFRLQRAPRHETHRLGMELFETLLQTDRYHASRMLQALDDART